MEVEVGADNADKLAKKEQARLLKQQKEMERAEKRAKKAELAAKKEEARAAKEALKHEKELKREQMEAEKEKKRREREAKRQLEEAKRLEKEAAERKKNAVIQKQASIMNRFFKKEAPKVEHCASQEVPECFEKLGSDRVSTMDEVLNANHTIEAAELLRKHVDVWKGSKYCEKPLIWGVRRTPKVELFKELKLEGESFKTEAPNTTVNESMAREAKSSAGWRPRKKLLQFHKCFRPAYYGSFSKKSSIVGPRHPLKKEPMLDYDFDSDDEWEEESPGESLSDCDEDDEEDKVEDDESADEFVVPDGYLSDNEGIEVDCAATKAVLDLKAGSITDSTDAGKLQTILDAVTERALKTNRPYIIRNFRTSCNDVDGEAASDMRKCCLQALRVQILAEEVPIERPAAENAYEYETPKTGVKRGRKPGQSFADADLPEIVEVLQGTPQGMKKIVEALSQKFPRVPKSKMETKVREISIFVDNHWKVKEEVLSSLQNHKRKLPCDTDSDFPALPCKPMSQFFQKRCLPLEENGMELESLNA